MSIHSFHRLLLTAVKTIHLQLPVQLEISRTFNISQETASVFYRAIIKGETYYSRAYERAKVRNSYTIEYIDSDGRQKFGYIEYFVSLTSHTAIVITPLIPTQ